MPTGAAEATGTLATALAHTERLLASKPALAETQAQEILKSVPGHPEALLLLGAARRRGGNHEGALEVLRPLAKAQPRASAVHSELALALAAMNEADTAIAAMTTATRLMPQLGALWKDLGDQFSFAENTAAAFVAYGRHLEATKANPALIEAATALNENRLSVAEHLLRPYIKVNPGDVYALRMLAEVGARLGRIDDADAILARCLELAPGFTAARHNYAIMLHRQGKTREALEQVDLLVKHNGRSGAYLALKAAILSKSGEYTPAVEAYEEVLAALPEQGKIWMSYGHALKTMGRQRDSIAAYRRSISLLPAYGEAYWSLANLKTFRFDDAEIERMRRSLEQPDIAIDDRFHLHFALGKALEDRGAYAESFEHYRDGNALRRSVIDYNPNELHDHVLRSEALFTSAFFAERAGLGSTAPDPIFVVGLPRSGSTLVEQVLASHSAIEGTSELSNILTLAKRLSGKRRSEDPTRYPETVAPLNASQLNGLGEEYVEQTRIHRQLGRPFFIDKMPNNFAHTGIIHLILPNAKVIDVRRHPLACCFSVFKQHFARGQHFSYDLTEIGRYYADYVRLMAHYDAVLPGRVHRVIYEDLVADPELEVRRLLDYCGVPFEEGCLRFYENDRAVRTASSEQVRQPIFKEGLDQWQNYEAWLGPLKEALGDVLEAYPAVPAFGGKC
jgi:tetratricopeptide (TPR) repeat protein